MQNSLLFYKAIQTAGSTEKHYCTMRTSVLQDAVHTSEEQLSPGSECYYTLASAWIPRSMPSLSTALQTASEVKGTASKPLLRAVPPFTEQNSPLACIRKPMHCQAQLDPAVHGSSGELYSNWYRVCTEPGIMLYKNYSPIKYIFVWGQTALLCSHSGTSVPMPLAAQTGQPGQLRPSLLGQVSLQHTVHHHSTGPRWGHPYSNQQLEQRSQQGEHPQQLSMETAGSWLLPCHDHKAVPGLWHDGHQKQVKQQQKKQQQRQVLLQGCKSYGQHLFLRNIHWSQPWFWWDQDSLGRTAQLPPMLLVVP